MSEKLKPCPFCGSDDLVVCGSEAYPENGMNVHCMNCDTEGPLLTREIRSDTLRQDTISIWNTREQSAAETMRWQPIETAPKDGTEIILRKKDRVTVGAWEEWTETASEYHASTGVYLGQSIQGGGAMWMSWDGGFREDDEPTHWMPLSPAPIADSEDRYR